MIPSTTITTGMDRFAEDKKLRDAMIDRIEVLERVKGLMVIPELEMITTRQVAEFYEIDKGTLDICIHRHKQEIAPDGMTTLTSTELLHLLNVSVKEMRGRGQMIVTLSNGHELQISPSKTTFFSKRAVLRIGMLLTQSPVAQEVRTQLLNTVEQTTEEQRTVGIDEEQRLLLTVIYAKTSSEKAEALGDLKRFMDRYKERAEELTQENEILQQGNEILARQAMSWDYRSILNKLVRMYAGRGFKIIPFREAMTLAWSRFYEEMLYSHHIGLVQREPVRCGDTPLDRLCDHEWPVAVAKAYAMCQRIGCEIRSKLNDDVYQIVLDCEHKAQAIPAQVCVQ